MEYTDIQIKQLLDLFAASGKIGLVNGKSGVALAGFLLARQTGAAVYLGYAEKVLAQVYEELEKADGLDFPTGLAGIGWMMEWVEQAGFRLTRSLDVLYEIDDFIYKVATMAPLSFTLDGSIGYLLYICKRLLHRRPLLYPYRQLAFEECALYLVRMLGERIDTSTDRKEGMCFRLAVEEFYQTAIQNNIALALLQRIERNYALGRKNEPEGETGELRDLLRFLFLRDPAYARYLCLFNNL